MNKYARSIIIAEYHKNPNICLQCEKPILVYGNQRIRDVKVKKFCNLSCANKYSSARRPLRRRFNHCLLCNKKTFNKKYCSVKCDKLHKWKLLSEKIENGDNVNPLQKKKYLIERYGHQCMICGRKTWMHKPIPIIMDHINGRASDNRLVNLRLVCANCDAQLPTYKSKNKNSDRKR